VFAFGELYPFYKGFYESTSLGAVKVFDSLGMSQGVFAFLLIVIAVGAFAATTAIEKRVNKKSAPSLAFSSANISSPESLSLRSASSYSSFQTARRISSAKFPTPPILARIRRK